MNKTMKNISGSEEFVNLKSDAGFKAVLADPENKGLLIQFLNAILPELMQVKDISKYADRELPGFAPQSKYGRLDLYCISTDGRHFVVEMQNEFGDTFFQRCVWYCSNIYSGELMSGDDYSNLAPVYLISILGGVFPHPDRSLWGQDDIISRYRMTEMRTGEVAPDTFLITFVEFGRFRKKSIADVRTRLEWICYLFNNPEKMGRVLEAADDGFIRDFTRACNVAGFSPQKKIQYEKTMMNEMDYRAAMKYREEKGRKEGKLEIAQKMLAKGMDMENITELTGLTPQEIEELVG